MTGPQKSLTDEVASTVQIRLLDPLGKSIEGLKYQIREGQKIVAKGVTDAEGNISAFVSRVGAQLSVHVERFATEEMKHVKTIIPWAEDYRVKLLSGKVKEKVKLEKDAGDPGKYRRKTHEVKSGDTLGKIAAKCGSSPAELARLNGIKVTDTIYPGQILKLPPEKHGAAPAAHPAKPAPAKPAPAPAAPAAAASDAGAGEHGNHEDQAPVPPGADAHMEPQAAKIIPIKAPVTTAKEADRGETGTPKTTVGLVCDQSACIKLGAKGRLVEEINIRLAGFGGTILSPHAWDEFTTKTEAAVKNFQQDYMKVAPTGKVCGSVLRAMDEFADKYAFDLSSMRCPCGECGGFGSGFTSSKDVDFPKNGKFVAGKEFPGIHRAVLSWFRAARFYIEDQEGELGYRFLRISSAYRCWHDNKRHDPPKKTRRWSTNHMGNALDIQFKKTPSRDRIANPHIDKIRNDILVKHKIARMAWGPAGSNGFCLERTSDGASSWVHIDVRTFEDRYKLNRFYATTQGAADGESMVALAKANSLLPLVNCGGIAHAPTPPAVPAKPASAPKPAAPAAKPAAPAQPAAAPAPSAKPAAPAKPAAAPVPTGDRQPIASLELSAKGIAFIQGFEKCELKPYDDNKNKDASKNYCTIGWGHLIDGLKNCDTLKAENSAKYAAVKNGITREQADAIFLKDLQATFDIVLKSIHVPLYQHEYDALVSLAFNAGGKFLKFKKLIAKANARDYSGCCAEFADITSGGLAGLVLRRKREMDMFTNAIYNSKH